MAKKTEKRPSSRVKLKAGAPARPNHKHKKRPAIVAKAAVKPAKKSVKPAAVSAVRPTAKSAAKPPVKPAAAARPANKSKPHRPEKAHTDRPGKGTNGSSRRTSPQVAAAPVVVARPPQSSNGNKPRKNPAGLSFRELEHFRDLLLAKRRELIGDMSAMEREALRSSGTSNLSNLPIHMADMGTDNYEQEFTLGLVQKDRDLLKEINLALAKMQNNTYGLCEGTGLPILKERLEYQPWARYSVEHQRKMERHGR